MQLSDRDIRKAIEEGSIGVTPLDLADVQPASVDVHLGTTFIFPDEGGRVIDPTAENPLGHVSRLERDWAWVLNPGQCVLATTDERVWLSDGYAARFEGKSSLGRCFLAAHITAGFIDPGFVGRITLELKNNLLHRGIRLVPGMAIGQLTFTMLETTCVRPYGSPELGSHYQGQLSATAPAGLGK